MSLPAAAPPPAARTVALGALLVVAVVAVYAGTLTHEFIWDDDLHVAANPTIIGPLGLKEIWSSSRANYFPLVLTNFWLQHAVWGLNPVGYHAVTILCHALAAVLLWRVLLALRIPGAWLGAALWALHPVQVESVAWISELKNTQSGIFFLLSILYWLKWLERGRGSPAYGGAKGDQGIPPPSEPAGIKPAPQRRVTGLYVLTLVFAIMALLSKPSTVMLPVALALVAWWQRRRFEARTLLALAPFFALSGVVSGWTIWEQKFHSGAIGAEWSQTWPERCVIAGRVIWFYLGKLAWPHPLSFIYPRWPIHADSLVAWLPFVLAIVGLGGLWRARDGRWAPVFFAAAFFGALLFPVLGFFNVYFFRYSFVGDHFQYLASIGPLALLGAGLARLPWRGGFVAASALLAGLGCLTWRQTPIYRDNTALWQSTVARTPEAVMAWLNLGDVLSWNKRYTESIAAYREALRLRPTDPDGHNDLGNVLTLTGDAAAAVGEFERALALKPDSAATHNNLGNALRTLGRDAEAMTHYAEAVRLEPDYAGAHNNLGVELAESGRFGEAIPHFEAALRARPEAVKTRDSLVRALHRHGLELIAGERWREAATTYRRAVELVPRSAPFYEALAVALVNSDRMAEAVPVLQTALQLEPNSAELHDNLGQVLLGLGRRREALDQMDEAARLRRGAPR